MFPFQESWKDPLACGNDQSAKLFHLQLQFCLINVSSISKELPRFSSSCLCAFNRVFTRARCWLSFWSAFFSGCKDSVTRLHLHFYHCLLNLNNLSCSSQLLSPLVFQNQSEALAFVIKLILEAPAISDTLSFLLGLSWGGRLFLKNKQKKLTALS